MTPYQQQEARLRLPVTGRKIVEDIVAAVAAENAPNPFKVRSGNVRRLGKTERWALKTKSRAEMQDDYEF